MPPKTKAVASSRAKSPAKKVASSKSKAKDEEKKPRSAAKNAKAPTYAAMITAAITAQQNPAGSSLQALKKYLSETYDRDIKSKAVANAIKSALKKMVSDNELVQVKGSYKLSLDMFGSPPVAPDVPAEEEEIDPDCEECGKTPQKGAFDRCEGCERTLCPRCLLDGNRGEDVCPECR